MKYFNRLSIKNKMVVIILFVTTAALLSGTALIVVDGIKSFKKNMVNEISLGAQITGDFLVTDIAFKDKFEARRTISQMEVLPDVKYACVYDESRNLIAAIGSRGPEPKQISYNGRAFIFDNNLLHLYHPVEFEGTNYGTLYVQASTVRLYSKITTFLGSIVVIIFLLFGLSSIIAYKLQSVISRPILELAAITGKVSKEADYSIRVQRENNDEIGKLYAGFNAMLEQIEGHEKALRHSETRYRTLFEQATDAIIIANSKGKFITASPSACKLIGCTENEALQLTFDTLIPEEDQKDDPIQYQTLKAGKEVFRERRFKRKDGLILDVEVSAKMLEDGRIQVFARNISDRKRAEKELLEKEQRYRSLFENSPIAKWEEDFSEVKKYIKSLPNIPEGGLEQHLKDHPDILHACVQRVKVIDVNQAALRLHGAANKDELISRLGNTFTEVSLKTFRHGLLAILTGQASMQAETVLQSLDGRIQNVLLRWSVPPGFENDLGRVLVTIEDITERKRNEEELQKMQKLQSVGILAGGIAHDFNNILVGLYGNISLAKARLSKTHASYESLEDAEKSMNRARRLTKQLLTFAKGGSPVKEDIRIDELIKDVTHFDLSGSSVKPVFTQVDDLWMAKIDKGQIQQVFSNLIINAKQAMPNGGHLYITLENYKTLGKSSASLAEGDYIKIKVTDEGIGIPKEYLDKIFDPYFTTKDSGSGLGLATSYSIITKHRGDLSVESEPGKGTIFTVYLPASNRSNAEQAGINYKQSQIKKQNARILVMDDEKVVCEVTAKMLERCGFDVETASDGKQAVECYMNSLEAGMRFDAVIMDLTVPGGVGGKEAIKSILDIDTDARVIVSSGYADDPILADYSAYGFKGIAEKPYMMSQLQDVLNKVLNG